MDFLTIDSIKKVYGKTTVLKDINLSLGEGNFLVLVGPSGCGKTTLLNIIAGLDAASDGKLFIKDQDVTNLLPSERDIAMVFQSYALYPNMTVRRNISFGLEMRKTPKDIIAKKVAEVSAILQISHLLERKPSQLSGGQRQRVAMGRAIVRDPQIFLFDEPLSNLDAKLRVEMRTEIKKLHRQLKATVVYVTHDQIEALTLADYIAVMSGGEIQQLGPPADIYNQPINLFTASFMGSTSMNFVEVTVKKAGDFYQAVAGTQKDQVTLNLPVSEYDSLLAKFLNKKLVLGMRPEDISLQDSLKEAPTSFVRKVDFIETAGSDHFVNFNIADKAVIARIPAKLPVKEDATHNFLLDPSRVHLFDPASQKNVKYL